MTGTDDEDVRRLLRTVDPARSLPALDRDELAEQIAAATGEGTRTVHSRRRSPWLIVGVGALSAGAAADREIGPGQPSSRTSVATAARLAPGRPDARTRAPGRIAARFTSCPPASR